MRDLTDLARHRLVTAVILLAGLALAGVLYATASPPPSDPDALYEWEISKRYARDLEVVGGKALAFTERLNDWIAGLWQGRSLAYTIAFVAALVALCYYVVRHPRRRR